MAGGSQNMMIIWVAAGRWYSVVLPTDVFWCVFSLSKPASREVRMLQVRMEVYSIEINILQVFDPRETIALDQWYCLVPSRSESDRCPTSGHLGFHAYVGCWTRVSDNSWQPTSWVIHWAWLILTNLGSWIWSTIEQRFYWLMTDYLIGFLRLQLHRITNNESSGLGSWHGTAGVKSGNQNPVQISLTYLGSESHFALLYLKKYTDMAMDQYLLIPFLGGWTSIYQLFWCSPGVQGFDTLPHRYGTSTKTVEYSARKLQGEAPPVMLLGLYINPMNIHQ